MKIYYTIYKVTNKINGKFYIGSHKTNNLNDNYMGSGKYLKYSQNKHGIENFEKEILFVYDNSEDMFAKEAEIVSKDFISEENTYNLKIGGMGGWDWINSNITTHQKQKRAKAGRKTADEILQKKYGDNYKKIISKKGVDKLKEILQKDPDYLKRKNTKSFLGKCHSEKTKKIIGQKNSIHQSGSGNSQYGTRWIHNFELKKSKRISKTDFLPEGWIDGRKMKFE